MKLIDIILDILNSSPYPLIQSEILEAAKIHKEYSNCDELQRVKVQISAIARTLSKYSVGTDPIIGIFSDKQG